MSISNIPFQPIQFDIDQDCCTVDYCVPAQDGDLISAQVALTLCGNETQELSNFDFSTGDTTDWQIANPSYAQVIDDVLYLEQGQSAGQSVSTGSVGDVFLVEISVLSFNGTSLEIGWTGNTELIDQAGTYTLYLTKGTGSFRMLCNDAVASIEYVKMYQWHDADDFEVFIVNSDNTEIVEITTGKIVTGGYFSVTTDWADLGIDPGSYYLRIELTTCEDETILTSNCFRYAGESINGCTLLLRVCSDERYALGWDFDAFTPQARYYTELNKPKYPILWREMYTNSSGRSTLYGSEQKKVKEIRIVDLPEWAVDFLGVFPSMSTIWANGQRYLVDSDENEIDISDNEGGSYNAEITLTLDGVSIKNVNCGESTASCSEPGDLCMDWNDGETIDWNDNECIEWNV